MSRGLSLRLSAALAVLVPVVGVAGGVEDAKRLVSLEVSDGERETLRQGLASAPFAEVAPALLPTLVEGPGVSPSPCEPLLAGARSPRSKAFCAAQAVWSEQLARGEASARADVLVKLLASAKEARTVSFLLTDVCVEAGWSPRAEAMVARVRDAGVAPEQAANCLLLRGDVSKHLPAALRVVKRAEPGLPRTWRRSQVYLSVFNIGDRVHELAAARRNELVDYGFHLLAQDEAEGASDAAYFTARYLGFVLKVPGEFAPDSTLEKYQGPHGLTPRYFADTVKNALHWREASRPWSSRRELGDSAGRPVPRR
ncbi:hypothetical protein SAMN05443572_11038 [Myxococcus fulvus]|uniref:Uncharacterized protein n=1 Tax=Myxococcus fulvus TaxID=33 RepID=A0A511T854_MYXFU|nr:hypothetical protein [Myxococcus fulvus]GEN10360.1 hypothetical protein MFU01_53970 [Myxococcus fulvus]SEU34336.1 hypothetical protein SAMN05443572_11038 [Myxococcus fulvus]